MKRFTRFTALLLAGVLALALLTGCDGTTAINAKNISDALNDYAARWGMRGITFTAGSSDKAQRIADYIENDPGTGDPSEWDAYLEDLANTCGVSGEPDNGVAYLFGNTWMGTKLINNSNQVAYYASDLLDAFLSAIYSGTDSESCFILSDMSDYSFAEKLDVKVSIAIAHLDPENADAKVLVVLYEVPIEEAQWTPPKL